MRPLLVTLLLAAGTGCTVGAHGGVTANSARYPISMSQHVRDRDGQLVPPSQLQKVGLLRYESASWAMLWGLIPTGDDHDISELVNNEVARAGGDAVVNLIVTSQSCGWNSMVYFNPLYVLPMWPGCVNIEVEGDIVRLKDGQDPATPLPIRYDRP